MNITLLPKEFSGEPEVTAMLQAFYSRSAEPIQSRLARLGSDVEKVKAALNRYYVGYGHKSIGDCGTVTLFVEGVSIIAAKALQNDPRYNGQECSTRYIDLSNAPTYKGLGTEWLELYKKATPKVIAALKAAHPGEGAQWENGIKAKAFDITRSLLPASTLTNLSVSVTLRVAREMIVAHLGHPLDEVRAIGARMLAVLSEAYPSSFGELHQQELDEVQWRRATSSIHYDSSSVLGVELWTAVGKVQSLKASVLDTAPAFTPNLAHVAPAQLITMRSCLDYGSWRDLQRHRLCIATPPLLTPHVGVHEWYIDELRKYAPAEAEEAEHLMLSLQALRSEDFSDAYTAQYELPLGTTVAVTITMPVAQALYVARLRSSPTVHPTLRNWAFKLDEILGSAFDVSSVVNKADADLLRRGKQTIQEK